MTAKLSQTAVGHANHCLHAYQLYLKHRGGPQNSAMLRGSLFHSAAERVAKLCLEAEEPAFDPYTARDIALSLAEECPEAVPHHEREALALMAYQYAAASTFDPQTVVGVEQMWELELEGRVLRGRIDRLDRWERELHVRDFKTSLYVPPQDKVQSVNEETGKRVLEEDGFQLGVYGLLATEGRPVIDCEACQGLGRNEAGETCGACLGESVYGDPLSGVQTVVGSYEYPRYRREDTGLLVQRTAELSLTDIADVKRTLVGIIKKIERAEGIYFAQVPVLDNEAHALPEDADREAWFDEQVAALEARAFPATPSSHCARCPAIGECPIPEQLKDYEEIESHEDADAVAQIFALTEDIQKKRRESIKAYVEDAGPLYIGDQVWDFSLSESVNWKRLAEQGGEPWEHKSQSTRFAKRKVKKGELAA